MNRFLKTIKVGLLSLAMGMAFLASPSEARLPENARQACGCCAWQKCRQVIPNCMTCCSEKWVEPQYANDKIKCENNCKAGRCPERGAAGQGQNQNMGQMGQRR